jgi:hypothetical protein
VKPFRERISVLPHFELVGTRMRLPVLRLQQLRQQHPLDGYSTLRSYWTQYIRLTREKAWGLKGIELEPIHSACARFFVFNSAGQKCSGFNWKLTEHRQDVRCGRDGRSERRILIGHAASNLQKASSSVPYLSRLVFISRQIRPFFSRTTDLPNNLQQKHFTVSRTPWLYNPWYAVRMRHITCFCRVFSWFTVNSVKW